MVLAVALCSGPQNVPVITPPPQKKKDPAAARPLCKISVEAAVRASVLRGQRDGGGAGD